MLVERRVQREVLRHAVADPQGGLVLITGEAGAGKSSLVRALAEEAQGRSVLVGACDNLRTPRPLGPVWDWAHQGSPTLLAELRDVDPTRANAVRDRVLSLLHAGAPPVLVIEDVHWADDATLDLLVLLGRRVRGSGALLVVTYRADEVQPGSPLAMTLGDLAGTAPVRMAVPPLTLDGVRRLLADTAAPVAAEDLLRRTGGNAFFVTECLSNGGGLPATVRDAVLARLHSLPAPAVRVAESWSVHPQGLRLDAADLDPEDRAGLVSCLDDGLLRHSRGRVTFRHELARLTVCDSLSQERVRALHLAALAAVLDREPVDAALAVHHALAAGDEVAAARHAVAAADHAEETGARREALAHLAVALGAAEPGAGTRDLLVRAARLHDETGDHEAAVAAYDAAADMCADLEESLWWRLQACNPLAMAGRTAEAGRRVEQALAELGVRADGRAGTLALAQRCSLAMLERRLQEVERWAPQTIRRAVELGEEELAAFTEIQSGTALFMAGEQRGYDRVRVGMARARSLGSQRMVLQGLSQIGSGSGEIHAHDIAVPALREAVELAQQHELHGRGSYSQAWLGRCQLLTGEWDAASATLTTVLASPRTGGITRLTALAALGLLRARRGDPDPWTPLDEALALAEVTGHLQRLWPVATARAEAAWLEGRLEEQSGLLDRVLGLALTLDQPWATGELAWWVRLAGRVSSAAFSHEQEERVRSAPPHALALAGRHREAAEAWTARGCGYDAARCLAASTDPQDQREALDLWTRLGATPAADRLRDQLRRSGRRVPRGPNASTASNRAGLTTREAEVLALLAEGLSNAEIAAREHLSTKTVGHHVSHILAKLHAANRTDAVRLAIHQGLVTGAGPVDSRTRLEMGNSPDVRSP